MNKNLINLYKKTGRNDPCPCGSGKKFKKCCLHEIREKSMDVKKLYARKYQIRLKNKREIEGIRKAGRLVVKTLEMVAEKLHPGMITEEINTLVHEFTIQNGAIPAPLNYRGFPKSVCVSPNEVICHGIPGKRVLSDGDIVNIDVTPILDGYYADANRTFFIGSPSPEAKRIVDVTRNALKRGFDMLKPGNTIGDIGWAIQRYAENKGCSVVREFVGHGVGNEFHEPPQVPHYGKKGDGIILVPGMVFTIEPMINLGGKSLYILDDDWTAITADGSLSAQFEQTIVITESGFESLTPFEL